MHSTSHCKVNFILLNCRWEFSIVIIIMYFYQMISERIIYACLDALLEGILCEEQLECFTYLIAIVGKDLTHSQPVRNYVYNSLYKCSCVLPVGAYYVWCTGEDECLLYACGGSDW